MQRRYRPCLQTKFQIPGDDLQLLHRFASENPIYRDSHESVLHGIRCIVYEGDANKYWLGSILHEASRAPFSPTWIASAYVLARLVKGLGYRQVIDVGSGDGRLHSARPCLAWTPMASR